MKKLKALSMATVGAVVAAVGTLAANPAQAATFNFTGTLNQGEIYTFSTDNTSSFTVGSGVTGSLTFDEKASATINYLNQFYNGSEVITYGEYAQYKQNPAIKFLFNIGNKTYETIGSFGGESYIDVGDHYDVFYGYQDEYIFSTSGNSENKYASASLYLIGSTDILYDIFLPSTPPDLSLFSTKQFSFISVDDVQQTVFNGTLETLTLAGSQPGPVTQPVPEPASTLGILAFGAMGGGSLLRRRKKLQTSKA